MPFTRQSFLALVHDMFMAAIAVWLSYSLRLGFEGWRSFGIYQDHVLYGSALFVPVAGICFVLMGMYRGSWRYASVGDLVKIAKASILAILLFIAIFHQLNFEKDPPRSVPVIQWLVLMALLGGPRLLYRAWKDKTLSNSFFGSGNKNRIPVLLAGCDDGAELFIRSIMQDSASRYRIVGILGSHARQTSTWIHSVPVLGTKAELESIVERLSKKGKSPQRLILTDLFLKNRDQEFDLQEFATQAEKLGLSLGRLPQLTEFKEGAVSDTKKMEVRPIAIEDLLGRAQAKIDTAAIGSFIFGKTVLVTGAGGSIGSELARQIASYQPQKLVLLENGEYNLYAVDQDIQKKYPTIKWDTVLCDIRNRDALDHVFANCKPDLVFHAAALKHVPLVEMNPLEGVQTNIHGTRNVADCAKKYGAQAMVQISTDKAVNPANVMGATKRLGEYYCQALDLQCKDENSTRFFTVRFGNVLGSSGSVVPLFERQLEEGGPITVTHPDIERFFMTIREASGLVLQASVLGISNPDKYGRIFVLDMGRPVKIVDVAKQMIRLADLEPDKDIKIVYTGLRPGEKLYEELFDERETPIETSNKSIMAAIPQPIDARVLQKCFDRLEKAVAKGDESAVSTQLKETVPGYEKHSMESGFSCEGEKDNNVVSLSARLS